jgi:uncharacterized protein
MRKPKTWLIHVPGLKQGENRISFELDIEEILGTSREVAENPSFQQLVGPDRVEMVIVKTGKRLLVNGKVGFRARLLCATCGKSFEKDFLEDMASEFVGEEEAALADRELEPDELVQEMFQGNVLNVLAAVRDTIHLGIPLAPKCSPGCKGVCPKCGADLNEEECACSKEVLRGSDAE